MLDFRTHLCLTALELSNNISLRFNRTPWYFIWSTKDPNLHSGFVVGGLLRLSDPLVIIPLDFVVESVSFTFDQRTLEYGLSYLFFKTKEVSSYLKQPWCIVVINHTLLRKK